MADRTIPSWAPGLDAPATRAFAITPNDSSDLAYTTRGLYVGGVGHVVAILNDDTASTRYVGMLAGHLYALQVRRVLATGTTATHLVGVY